MTKQLSLSTKSIFPQKNNSYRPLALAIALAFGATAPNISNAETYTVMNTNDAGIGSLRQAVLEANANSGADTILFDSAITGSTIVLTGDQLNVTDEMTVTGSSLNDSNSIILSGGGNSRIFSITNTSLVLENLTVSEGYFYSTFNGSSSNQGGGGILANGGSLTLEDVLITQNNTSGDFSSTGAGIATLNSIVVLKKSKVSENNNFGNYSNDGGGLYIKGGTLTINQSEISKNTVKSEQASGQGGGLSLKGTITIINDSSIIDNKNEDGRGGGIYVFDGSLTINKSIVSGNSVIGSGIASGGGIAAVGNGNFVTINESTLDNNYTLTPSRSYGGGISSLGSNIILNNSTVSNNQIRGEDPIANGGGISSYGSFGSVTLYQSTLSNNAITGNTLSGVGAGGGGLHISYNPVSIEESTIVGNSSNFKSGGLSIAGTDLSVTNSILSDNNGPDKNILMFSYGTPKVLNVTNTIFGDDESEINGINTANIFSNSPDLGALQDNGGPTLTHLPNLTSSALNAGNNVDITSDTDQRDASFTRILNGTVDIGAVEVSIPSKPIEVLKRSEIVKPLLQAALGDSFIPDVATGLAYNDVEVGDFNADWIEKFKTDEFTEGCAVDRFCPDEVITKEQLAKLILKVKEGINYTPMLAIGIYNDVPIGSFNADWIEALNLGGITTGCDTGRFCPKDAVTVEVFENILNAAFP